MTPEFLPSRRSPTTALLIGLIITLAAVVADAAYVTTQLSVLRRLQRDLADRSRQDSLLLLRTQNDFNALGLAMRDMLDRNEPYPLTAWEAQFQRIREDLDDAMRREQQVATASQTPEQRQYFSQSLAQFWDASDRVFALARAGRDEEARGEVGLSLQARQTALSAAVSRLLVQNNQAEDETARRVQSIYARVQRQVYWFAAATLSMIFLTGVALIRSNRRIFAELDALSERRRELAQQLITARESTLREISRELHDEFGQVLTAIGSLLARAARQAPVGSPLQADLHEIQEIAQTMLDKVRSLSQTLHPSALDDAGLEDTIEWYLSTVERQTGVAIVYEHGGSAQSVGSAVGIHIYRILQEALSNVVRHSGASSAWVRLWCEPGELRLEVEDHGTGLRERPGRGLGMVGMRERAALIGGAISFAGPSEGGVLVRLVVPLPAVAAGAEERIARVG